MLRRNATAISPTVTPTAKNGAIVQNSIGCTGSPSPRPSAVVTPLRPIVSRIAIRTGAPTSVQPMALNARTLPRMKNRPRRKFHATAVTAPMMSTAARAHRVMAAMIAATDTAFTSFAITSASPANPSIEMAPESVVAEIGCWSIGIVQAMPSSRNVLPTRRTVAMPTVISAATA